MRPFPLNRSRTVQERENLPELVRFLLTTYRVGARMVAYRASEVALTIQLTGESATGFEIAAVRPLPDRDETRFCGTLDECASYATRAVNQAIGEKDELSVEVWGDVEWVKAAIPKLLVLERSNNRVARAFARWQLRRLRRG